MRLSEKAIREFKQICRDECGVELSDTEAEQRALEVLDLFWLLLVESRSPRADTQSFDKLDPEDVPSTRSYQP